MRDVAEAHRYAGIAGGQRNLAKIIQGLEIAGGANHVLGLGQLEHRPAGLLIGVLDRCDHPLVRDVECNEALRVEHDLVLAHHSAEGGDFSHIRH